LMGFDPRRLPIMPGPASRVQHRVVAAGRPAM
jgi:hypothetical protein